MITLTKFQKLIADYLSYVYLVESLGYLVVIRNYVRSGSEL